jgi:ubiquinone/menaquinone biosynthesis C-methylase UbiE
MMNILKDIACYWDEYPCGIQVTDAELGSREFFDEIKKTFHENYAPLAHSDELLDFRGYQGKAVLEVGCGIGLDSLEFARHGAQVTAIDLSPTNVELARKYFKYHNLDAIIEVGNAEQLSFPDNTFDLAVAIGVLYYTPNTQKAVNEIFRVLKPGGKTICMFFNRRSWYVLLSRISRTNIDHEQVDPPVMKLYSVNEVNKLFDEFSGYEIIMDRFPTKTIKRSGILAYLYNYCLVPPFKMLPKILIRPFGFHIIIKAIK